MKRYVMAILSKVYKGVVGHRLALSGMSEISSIFDYNFVSRYRESPIEAFSTNKPYGMEYLMKMYSGYKKDVYCATEHGMPHYRIDNFGEYRDNKASIVLVHSWERVRQIQPYTDKLLIPAGPSFMPYTKSIYTKTIINDIKKTLGRTLLVFPQHNNDVTSFVDFQKNMDILTDYVETFKQEHQFDSVLVCLYYIDIARGLEKFYEDRGWRVVCAGHNMNYDFGNCLHTIFEIGDYTIAQGYSTIMYSLYMNKPATFVRGVGKQEREDGMFADYLEWQLTVFADMDRLFSEYYEDITVEQREYCKTDFGFEDVKSSEELKLILEFANEIKKMNGDYKKIRRVANRKEFQGIKKVLSDAIDCAETTPKASKNEVIKVEEQYSKIWREKV